MTELFTLARVGAAGREVPVVRAGGRLLDARSVANDFDGAFFADGGIDRVRAAARRAARVRRRRARASAPPIARPGKIVCIGLNYRDHAEETGAALPAEPVVFMKDPSTIVGPFDDVLIPRGSTKTDWEVELGVVIGTDRPLPRLARRRPSATSPGTPSRTTCRSASSSSSAAASGTRARAARPSTRSGPTSCRPSDVADPQELGLRLWVNGEQRQDGSTRQHALLGRARDLVPAASSWCCTRATSSTRARRRASRSACPARRTCVRATSVELEIDGLGRARQRMVQA